MLRAASSKWWYSDDSHPESRVSSALLKDQGQPFGAEFATFVGPVRSAIGRLECAHVYGSQDVREAESLCRTHNKANKLRCSCFGAAGKDRGLFLAVVGLGSGEGTVAVFVTLHFNIIQSPS